MSDLRNIEALIASGEGRVDPKLAERVKKYQGSDNSPVAETALFGSGVVIGDNVQIRDYAVLEDGVEVGANTVLSGGTHVQRGTVIGPRVFIGEDCAIYPEARICTDDVASGSSNARQISDGCIIGPGVMLDNEAELGFKAVVPTQRTIAFLGKFGAKNRVVTIYGSDAGPRYSIGCQMGVDFDTVVDRVGNSINTEDVSSGTYTPFLGIFEQIGNVVQKAYDHEALTVLEMRIALTDQIYATIND